MNAIEGLGRALFAVLSPLTGTRATGAVSVTSPAGGILPPNTYLLPVVGGQLRDDLLYKTRRQSAAASDWAVAAGVPTYVGITSNVGGAQHNLPAGTVFRFDPPLAGFDATATLDADMTDGASADQLVRRVAFFEDMDSTNPSKDIFAAKLGDYPALMLVWQDSEPVEGMTAGLTQGSTRGGRKVRFMRERFVLYVITGRLTGDGSRRQEGLTILQAATRLLSDRQQNADGEQLSYIGSGVEVNERTRLRRGERHYIYALRLRANSVLQPIDERTFQAWNHTDYGGALPGREAPEPTDPLTVLDALDPMP